MKHLFVVHSNITYLAALGVICKEDLPLEDVKIYSPHFIVNEPVPVEKLTFPSLTDAILRFRWSEWFNLVKVVDKQIVRFIGDNQFTAYVPSVPFPLNVFITHEQCAGFHFIEEGLSNYYPYLTLDEMCKPTFIPSWRFGYMVRLRNAVQTFRTGGLILNKIPYTYDSYGCVKGVNYYGFFKETFVNAPAGAKIGISMKDVMRRFNYRIEPMHNRVLLLGTFSCNLFTEDQYINTLGRIIDSVFEQSSPGEVLLKFHPIEPTSTRRRTIELLEKRNIAYLELSRNTMVELLLLVSEHLTVLGVGSTLNFYAGVMGHKSISYAKRLYPSNNMLLYSMSFWDKYVTEV